MRSRKRERKHQDTKPPGNPLKNRGVLRAMALHEIIDIVDNTKMDEARKALDLLDSQMDSRRIELLVFNLENVIAAENCLKLDTDFKTLGKVRKNPGLVKEFERITKIMREIAVLESRREKIESANTFMETFRTD